MRIDHIIGNVHIKLSTDRLDNNIKEAQKELNMKIVGDCDPYIPIQQGALRGSAQYPEEVYGGEITWGGKVKAGDKINTVPYAYYIYNGFLRTDETGRVFVGEKEKKPVLTKTPLKYHHPGTGSMWFETAKKSHGKDWIDLVKRKAGKG